MSLQRASSKGLITSLNAPPVQQIQVEWDAKTGGITVTPSQVSKGTTVLFKNPKGAKVRIVFLSPDGYEADTVADSESFTLTISGVCHFECFFTLPGAAQEIKAKLGGVIAVTPHRP